MGSQVVSLSPVIGDTINGRKLGKSAGYKNIWVACEDCGFERWASIRNGKVPRLCRVCNRRLKLGGRPPNRREQDTHIAPILSDILIDGRCPKCGQSGWIYIDEDGFPHCFCGKVIYK